MSFDFGDPRLPDRFWDKVSPEPMTGCWLWMAGGTRSGYGTFKWNGRGTTAHRAAYEVAHGGVPTGMQLDHLCCVPSCANPDHLEPVTARENSLRGKTLGAFNAAKTHCPSGHEYSPSNTGICPQGKRYCLECRRHRGRKKYQELREAAEKLARAEALIRREYGAEGERRLREEYDR